MTLYNSRIYAEDLALAVQGALDIRSLDGASILVVGAGGMIGSFLVDSIAFAARENNLSLRVIAAGRNMRSLEARFESCPHAGIELAELDASSPVPNNITADFVVHAASNAHPGSFVRDPVGTLMANVAGLANMADYVLSHSGNRLLYVSSGEIYGNPQSDKREYTEDDYGYVDILSPRAAYPMGKRAAETLLSSYVVQKGLDGVIVRPCHTYGPTATVSDTRASSSFIAEALAGRDIVMTSDGTQVRSYNHVVDTVSGLLCVLARGAAGEAYNLANPEVATSVYGFAKAVSAASGVSVERRASDEKAVQLASPITRQVLSSEKLESLGWRPLIGLKEGISRTLRVAREAGICSASNSGVLRA